MATRAINASPCSDSETAFFNATPSPSTSSPVDIIPPQSRSYMDVLYPEMRRSYVETYTSESEEEAVAGDSENVECEKQTVERRQSRKDKISQCSKCGASVRSSYMTRHQMTKKCSNDNSMSPPKRVCEQCGQTVIASNLWRHQKSKKCINTSKPVMNPNTITTEEILKYAEKVSDKDFAKVVEDLDLSFDETPVQNTKSNLVSCDKCGSMVSITNLARHKKSKRCVSFVAGNNTDKAHLVSCGICGSKVAITNLARHEKSKRCMSFVADNNTDKKLKNIGVIPAPKCKMCWICEKPVELSHWTRHENSERHIRLSGPSNISKTNSTTDEPSTSLVSAKEKVKSFWKEGKATKMCWVCKKPVDILQWSKHSKHSLQPEIKQTSTLDLNRLVQKYPKVSKKKISVASPTMDNVKLEAMIRKPTRPQKIYVKPRSKVVVSPTASPHVTPPHYTPPPSPISPLPMTPKPHTPPPSPRTPLPMTPQPHSPPPSPISPLPMTPSPSSPLPMTPQPHSPPQTPSSPLPMTPKVKSILGPCPLVDTQSEDTSFYIPVKKRHLVADIFKCFDEFIKLDEPSNVQLNRPDSLVNYPSPNLELNIPNSPVHHSPPHIPDTSTYEQSPSTEIVQAPDLTPTKSPSNQQTGNIIACPSCGLSVAKSHIARHMKTKKCQKSTESQNENIKKNLSDINHEKVNCPNCGVLVTRTHLARHKKTKKCLNALKDKPNLVEPMQDEDTSNEEENDDEIEYESNSIDRLGHNDDDDEPDGSFSSHGDTSSGGAQADNTGNESSDGNEKSDGSFNTRNNSGDTSSDGAQGDNTGNESIDDDGETSSDGAQGDKTGKESTIDENGLELKKKASSFKNRLKTFVIENKTNIKDPKLFLQISTSLVTQKINECVIDSNLKVNLIFHAEFQRVTNEKEIAQVMNFKTTNEIIYPTTDISEYYDRAKAKMLVEMEDFQATGSNWTLRKVVDLEVRINKYTPLRASSYIDLPKKIQLKNAVINVQNKDQKCFLWSILSALHPVDDNAWRINKYKAYEHELDDALQGIEFPVKLDDITKFEKRANISINCYTLDGNNYVVVPLRITKEELKRHVDLLYLKGDGTNHYCYIKNLSRLVSSQISNHGHKMWLCKRCLLHFGSEDKLNLHSQDCSKYEAVKINLPDHGSIIKFEDYNKSMKIPFVIYADFECLLESNRSRKTEKTQSYQKHLPMSFSYYIVSKDGDYKPPITYFGDDAGKVFIDQLEIESKNIQSLYSSESIKPMKLTKDDEHIVANSTTCHICEKLLNGDKVLDHDHLTGRFRGVAHNECNIKFRKPKFIPVFIHNLSGYDTHLFIKMLGLNDEEINVIPNNEERYISYTVKKKNMIELRFLDSFKFMSSSLDGLTKNLQRDQFIHTAKYFNDTQLDLVLRKGVYPYDYMDNEEKYQQTYLPKYEEFYNKLSKTNIKDTDYEHAKRVWDFFQIKNMKEYTLLYNKSDVLLLADVMENFRNVCISTYKLDPAWFFTTPGLAWSAMLKTTKIELELISDYEMLLMIEKGIRGGVSQCSNRYAKANNPYMRDYDVNKPTEYLMYLDANNLYGWAMVQHMPYKDFKWCDKNIDVLSIPDDADTGYIFEVDLEYPHELHDLHSDLPLAPEQRVPPGGKVKKLLTTLYDKERYVVHYRNLKLYLKLGMKIKKVHRVISFSQMNWIAPYIELNTKLRTQARNDFEKDFYKLMNNGVFGKTMENIRNRVDIRLATKEKQIVKWVALPTFKDRTIFAENLTAIHMRKTKLLFNKPIYVGMSVLDISKTLIYDFHYNVIKAKYGDKARLQYTDTDSLKYLVTTEDFYQDMKTMLNYYDTSDYPEDNPYGLPRVNKKVLGKMKDELNGKIMREQVALRSKMYAHEVEDGSVCKKSKGVKKSVTENEITFNDYKKCLFEGIEKKKDVEITKTINMIRSFNHDLYTIALDKTVLSNKDDKRCIMADGITSLPWGHYSLSN